MADLIELSQWEPGIYQLETDDPVLGGEDGIDNLQAKQLANRTQYLKQEVETRTTLAQVEALIAALVDSSPAALDTLNELAAALGDDPNFAATITNALAQKAPLESPALTGNPTAPTQAPGTNNTTLANTAFVHALLATLQDIADASETVKGIVELATDAEAQGFTANKVIDGAKLAAAFKGSNQSLAAGGYQKLPGGLIVQWGKQSFADFATNLTVNTTFPIAFPNNCFNVVATAGMTGGFVVMTMISESSITTSGFSVILTETASVIQTGGQVHWIAVGN